MGAFLIVYNVETVLQYFMQIYILFYFMIKNLIIAVSNKHFVVVKNSRSLGLQLHSSRGTRSQAGAAAPGLTAGGGPPRPAHRAGPAPDSTCVFVCRKGKRG